MQTDQVPSTIEIHASGKAQQHHSLDARSLRNVFGTYPTGVAIVTTRTNDVRPVGLTINSFASVSLDPPLVLWSLANRSSNYEVFRRCDHFAIHFLSATDDELASRFANPSIVDKFSGVAYEDSGEGVPLLKSAMTTLLCKQSGHQEAGDHLVLLGKVIKAWSKPAQPLVFHQGRFLELTSRSD